MKLFEHPISPFCQKVKIFLYEKKIPFECVLPDFIGNDTAFKAANPRQEVPALTDGETHIFDSSIIVQYLEDAFPAVALFPQSPAERAQSRMIEEVCDTFFDAVNWGLLEVRFFERASGRVLKTIEENAARQLDSLYGWLNNLLTGKQWLSGVQFGLADICAVPHVIAAVQHGFPVNAYYPALSAWFERVSQRESVMACVQSAKDAEEGYKAFPQLVRDGLFARQYRDTRLDWMMRSGGQSIVLDGLEKANVRFSADW